jgi:thiol-disulfide isomerase/thioredoxin
MQVGIFSMHTAELFRNVCRWSAPAVIAAAVVAIGCDRSTPEKLASQPVDNQPAAGEQAPAALPANQGAKPIANTQADDPAPTSSAAPQIAGGSAATDSLSTRNAPNAEVAAEAELPEGARVINQADLMNRAFMTLKPPQSDQPADLVAFLSEIDLALRDLIVAGTNNIVDSETFTSSGMRLGEMKFAAGERLVQMPNATDEHRKIGTLSQLVALSHMSGLKDVDSAKKLEKFASSLLQSSDPDLAHQGRVVLLGFRLQDLQNGRTSEPTQLLADLDGLFERPSDAGFPEMMVLQQSQQVLSEMGFAEAAAKIDALIVAKFLDSADLQLSMAAWGIAASKSQAFQNYNAALQDVYSGKEKQPQMLLAAARGLYSEFPNAVTLLQFVKLSTDLEFRGLVSLAEELSLFVKQQLTSHPNSPFLAGIQEGLGTQERRLGVRGQAVPLDGLVDVDGLPLDLSAYKGKVVLINFWATWCLRCREELPYIREAYSSFSDKGFDVLSINMDDDLAPVRQFLSSNQFPWKNGCSADPNAMGFKSAIAQKLGISAIPFVLIIDAEGKVAAIHVRGDRIAPTIRAMLSPGLSN